MATSSSSVTVREGQKKATEGKTKARAKREGDDLEGGSDESMNASTDSYSEMIGEGCPQNPLVFGHE